MGTITSLLCATLTMKIEQFLSEMERVSQILARDLFGGVSIPQFKLELARKAPFTDEIVHIAVGIGIIKLSQGEILAGILHELVHIYNRIRGVSDQTANHYHNRKFKNLAIQVGLRVTCDRNKGWHITSLTDGVQNNIDACRVNAKYLLEGKKQLRRMIQGRIQRPCFLKYICECPPPHNSIRSGRRPNGGHPLRIRCEVCGAAFVPEVV